MPKSSGPGGCIDLEADPVWQAVLRAPVIDATPEEALLHDTLPLFLGLLDEPARLDPDDADERPITPADDELWPLRHATDRTVVR